MRILKESKQVGNLIYFVADIETLDNILAQNRIIGSSKIEHNSYNNTDANNYVCLTRSKNFYIKNSNRWRYGIYIDGDKLSNKYNIRPYNYYNSTPKAQNYTVKYIVAYDNGTYKLSLLHYPTIDISKSVYDSIVKVIESQSDEYNDKKHLEISTGKRPRNGVTIIKKYDYRVPNGGIHIRLNDYPELKLTFDNQFDDYEERIWLKPNESLNIKGTVFGILVDKNDRYYNDVVDLANFYNLKLYLL